VTRGSGQHRDLAADHRIQPVNRPETGPIAVLPHETAMFVDAVLSGGGTVEPLSDATRGVVWLSEKHADDLATVLETHPGIQWVQLPWSGVDTFSEILARFAGQPFPLWTSAKGAYSEPVAEHALALTLALLRQFPQKARSATWMASPKTGASLFGLEVLLIGAGGIAREIIRLFSAFDVRVTVVRRSAEPLDGADRTVTSGELLEVLPTADVVIVAAASTDATAQLIGARELHLMKPSAVLVNIARGALVDTDALVAALAAGEIAGAGLDVTDPEPLPDGHPLWAAPNCLVTSHSADTPEMTGPLLAGRIRLNVEAFHGTDGFAGVVDPVAGY
jgi:phosphoglycerate dehydrogenase-like enzyme